MTKTIDTNEIRDNLHIYEPLVHGTLRSLCDEIDRLNGVQTPPHDGVTDEYLKETLVKLADYISNTPVPVLMDALIKAGHSPLQTPPQGKTVRAEIMVGVDTDGEWQGAGSSDYNDASATHAASTLHLKLNAPKFYKLTATLTVPQEVEVVAEVEDDKRRLDGSA